MHELSIAESIVRIADRHAAGRPVTAVTVKVGHLRQVVPTALEFAFALVAEGTAVEGAALVLADVPAAGLCRACGARSEFDAFPFACGGCGGFDIELTQGEELQVESLELEEALTTNGGPRDGR